MLRTNVDGLDANALLDVGGLGAVAHFVRQHLRLAEGVHEGRTAGTGGTCRRGTR